MPEEKISAKETLKQYTEEILSDFRIVCLSREASLLGRKEVLTGKAKFGIFGDGKELAQIAMAKQFIPGDWRSGYYRDQTFMMAIGAMTVKQYFAGLYAHTDLAFEPFSAGRQMGGHFSTTTIDENGDWLNLTKLKNSSADISPTGSQMPRLLGLALASKHFKENKELHAFENLSKKGNEVAFGTIGDASTSEGMFWETINAAGVMQVPMALSIWDDGYGISVPKKFQTTKASMSEVLEGFRPTEDQKGIEIFKVKGWNYPQLVKTYEEAIKYCRKRHIPVIIHVDELTQPQGHSTSGSHERYKSKERMQWETDFDCVDRFQKWIADFEYEGLKIASNSELAEIREQAKKQVREEQKAAWQEFTAEIEAEKNELIQTLKQSAMADHNVVQTTIAELTNDNEALKKDLSSAAWKVFRALKNEGDVSSLENWIKNYRALNEDRFGSHLYCENEHSPLNVPTVKPTYNENTKNVDGRVVLRENFEALFKSNPLLLTFGEDTGKIGGVNQSMEGMQEKFGSLRVGDTGIRECTIVGQGIGMAMRGLRPIAEIQYLDYLLYALQIMSDDLATVHYRTKGQQKAPLIVRTRGHRLEGIWHSGSPMGMIINSLRGIHVCVPRNMTEAAGMYNTLLQGDDPALVIEPLNGYRSKEKLPNNPGEFTSPLGEAEIVRNGKDLTLVSYGSTFNICANAATILAEMGIEVELIDVRTLLPFDLNHVITSSLAKTNRLLIVDEDVPGGASAYILDKILNEQQGFFHLDSPPKTLAAKAHRPAYSSDGDYYSKPNLDDIIEAVAGIMEG